MKKVFNVIIQAFLVITFLNITLGYAQNLDKQSTVTASNLPFNKEAFLDRFKKSFGRKAIVTVASIAVDKQNITLKDVIISGDVLTPDTRFKTITFINVKAIPHGGFLISNVIIDKVFYRYEKSTLIADTILLNGAALPPNEGIYNQNIGFSYDRGTFKSIQLLDEKNNPLGSLQNGEIRLTRSIRDNPVKFKIKIANINVEVKNFPVGTSRTDLINMGYSRASGSLILNGAYGGKNALLQLDQLNLTLNKGGKLDAQLKMDGITIDSLLTVLTLQRENDHGKIDKSRMALGMLGQVQRYNFYNGSFVFKDYGLTNKIINAQAKRENKTPLQLKEEWANGLPGWLSFAKKTSFFEQAKNQIIIFINNPKTLQFELKPMGRTSLVMLALAGKINPESLIKQLKPSIRAN